MMIRAAVVEDCRPEAEALVRALESLATPDDTVHAEIYSSGEEFLEAAAEKTFDVVFLDIQLEGLSGMEVAERVRAADKRTLIVFLTQTADFMSAGYKVRAFRYLLKPVPAEQLRECMTSARDELASAADGVILLGSGLQQVLIPADEVVCIRAAGNYVHVHTNGGKL